MTFNLCSFRTIIWCFMCEIWQLMIIPLKWYSKLHYFKTNSLFGLAGCFLNAEIIIKLIQWYADWSASVPHGLKCHKLWIAKLATFGTSVRVAPQSDFWLKCHKMVYSLPLNITCYWNVFVLCICWYGKILVYGVWTR